MLDTNALATVAGSATIVTVNYTTLTKNFVLQGHENSLGEGVGMGGGGCFVL